MIAVAVATCCCRIEATNAREGGGIAPQGGAPNGQLTAAMLQCYEAPMSHGRNATGAVPRLQLSQRTCKSLSNRRFDAVGDPAGSVGLKLESGRRGRSPVRTTALGEGSDSRQSF